MAGKNYANRKTVDKRPESDYYPTPKSLVWELSKLGILERSEPIIDPACGENAIVDALLEYGYVAEGDDLRKGRDFLSNNYNGKYTQAVMNPPFSLFDQFIMKAKNEFPLFASIIKVNFFGAKGRNTNGVWKGLKEVHVFNRMVDYRTPMRDDGLYYTGVLVAGWGIWDRNWTEDYWETRIMDVDQYAKLGSWKE